MIRFSAPAQLPITTAQTFAKRVVAGTTLRLDEALYLSEEPQLLIGDALLDDRPGLMLVIGSSC